MAAHNFRSAFHGFNREDVVRYIELLNNQHKIQLDQLHNQLQAAKAAPSDSELQVQLDAALAKCAKLEAQLANANTTERELEAYRRAERAERAAQERAQQIRSQTNAVLEDATAKAEAASQQIAQLSVKAAEQLQAYQTAVANTQELFQDVVASLQAINPNE